MSGSGQDPGDGGGAAGYLAELERLLLARGLPPDRVTETVAGLGAHRAAAAPGASVREFGPAAELARRLAPGERAAPEEHVETWRWTADVYADEALLNRFGDEGWEVERIDAGGRFVGHRDPERPRRWAYRREVVAGDRAALDRELARAGWQPCGTWVVYGWYKRLRPEPAPPAYPAEETETGPPARTAPARPAFAVRRLSAALVPVALALLAAAAVLIAVPHGEGGAGITFASGALAGAATPLLAARAALLRRRRRR
ncbi:hypothetical protein [Streptomyces sp. NPDC049813]|uniref:hypothetical protein n=1 Tax=Streptomyces sp. NPDC049813 TaxID=3365597 RepID=UPI0037B63E3C